MAATAQRLLDTARSQLGYLEPGWGDGPGTQRTKYGDWYAAWSGQAAYRDTFWCAMFVSWCLATAGFTPAEAGRYGNCRPWIKWAQAKGKWGRTPRVGAIVMFDWQSGGPNGADHVGIVESVRADGAIVTIEGNATVGGGKRDGVYRMVRRGSVIVGYIYPPFTSGPAPKPTPGGGSRPGYPTLRLGAGRAGDPVKTNHWWVLQWMRCMQRWSPGYFSQIAGTAAGAAEIRAGVMGPVTLRTAERMIRQNTKIKWEGAITPAVWALYPPVK